MKFSSLQNYSHITTPYIYIMFLLEIFSMKINIKNISPGPYFFYYRILAFDKAYSQTLVGYKFYISLADN